jgi:hypothetical protein
MIYAIVKMLLGFRSLTGEVAGPLRLQWPWALEADYGRSLADGFTFYVSVVFQCLLKW